MKRMNSNPSIPADPNKDFDEQSIFISGNLLPEKKLGMIYIQMMKKKMKSVTKNMTMKTLTMMVLRRR